MTSPLPILALDVATLTGWACLADPEAEIVSGITDSRGGNIGAQLHLWQQQLCALLERTKPYSIWREAPIVRTGPRTGAESRRQLMAFHGILDLEAYRIGVPVKELQPNSLKAHAGSARYDKKQMMVAAKFLTGVEPKDHNEADALVLLDYALQLEAPRAAAARYRLFGKRTKG